MPIITKEDLDGFHKQIDDLEKKRNDLDELSSIYIQRNERKSNQIKAMFVVFFLLILVLGVGSFLVGSYVKENYISVDRHHLVKDSITIVQQDLIKQIDDFIIKDQNNKISPDENLITYGVQLGAYEEFDVEFSSAIKKIQKDNGWFHYVLGGFETIEEANYMLLILEGLKVKNAFVVGLKNGDVIDL